MTRLVNILTWLALIAAACLTGLAFAYTWTTWPRQATFIAMVAGMVAATWVVGQVVDDVRQARRDRATAARTRDQLRVIRQRGGVG